MRTLSVDIPARKHFTITARSHRLSLGGITRIMGISLHTYISGVPHRIKYVEQVFEHIASKPDVLLWTGEQILDWYLDQTGAG